MYQVRVIFIVSNTFQLKDHLAPFGIFKLALLTAPFVKLLIWDIVVKLVFTKCFFSKLYFFFRLKNNRGREVAFKQVLHMYSLLESLKISNLLHLQHHVIKTTLRLYLLQIILFFKCFCTRNSGTDSNISWLCYAIVILRLSACFVRSTDDSKQYCVVVKKYVEKKLFLRSTEFHLSV